MQEGKSKKKYKTKKTKAAATEVYRRYGNDLPYILKSEKIHLREEDCWWRESLIADEVRKEICLNCSLSNIEQRVYIAHALGHYFLHEGNRFYFAETNPTVLERDEQEAWEFAAYLLLPEDRLARSITRSLSWIADNFKVTQDLVRLRFILWVEDHSPE